MLGPGGSASQLKRHENEWPRVTSDGKPINEHGPRNETRRSMDTLEPLLSSRLIFLSGKLFPVKVSKFFFVPPIKTTPVSSYVTPNHPHSKQILHLQFLTSSHGIPKNKQEKNK